MFLTQNLEEESGEGRSQSSLAFSPTQSNSVRTWLMPNPLGLHAEEYGIEPYDLQLLVKSILGGTENENDPATPSRLVRTLPLCDPSHPWLYASNIQSMKGLGIAREQPAELNTNSASFPAFNLYPHYEVVVDCTARPYPVSPDSAITKHTVDWYDTAGTHQSKSYYDEWNRFTDFTDDPLDDWLEMQRGTCRFETASGAEPGGTTKATAQQSVRMLLPNSTFKLLWVGVPYNYIQSANSYIKKFRGMVNQNSWNGPQKSILNAPLSAFYPGGDEGLYTPGSLLYLGYKPRTYNPVLPVTYSPFGSYLDYSKLVDIELLFLLTNRITSDAPPLPSNKNIVIAGHNALPYFPKRKFYYCVNYDLAGNKYPQFWSFPIEMLFQNPDDPDAYTGPG